MSERGEKPTLNSAQAQAVAIDDGPALIIAGAGTGKTKVIVERIHRLLQKGVPAQRILALTFTEKAASEMLDRITELSGSFQLDMPVMTFNAYGESLLRRYAADIGLSRHFSLLGDSAQVVFLRERLDQLGLDYFAPIARPDALLGDIGDYFSQLKQQVITAKAYETFAAKLPQADEAAKLHRLKHLELSSAFNAYQELCRQADVIDYDDQIYLLLELFAKRPNVLAEVQAAYDYILVDEFQDTNTMQSQLVDLLAGKHKNLFVVGDDDQSIYGWRGATLANILDFKQRYPKAQEVTLIKNYRSSQAILDAAYRLIQHNNPDRLEERLKIDKHLQAEQVGEAPHVRCFETLDEELHWIAQDIQRQLDNGVVPGDIAVLTRRNATAQLLHGQLDFAGIDHVVTGQRYELYQEPIVRHVLEAIKAIADPADSTSLYHLLTGPLCGLAASLLSQYASQARRERKNLLELLETAQEETIAHALQLIKDWRDKSATLTVGLLVYEMLDSSGYKEQLYSQAVNDPVAALAVSRLSEFFKTLKQFEHIALQPSVVQYVEALPALQAAGDSNEDGTLDLSGQVVNVLTIHKSKGLEWPVVYIADCTEGSFPLREMARGIQMPEGLTANSTAADTHLAEERRLMYVAMTRAKHELTLTYAEQHSSASRRKPSRFLSEAFEIDHTQAMPSTGQAAPDIGRFGPTIPSALPLPASMLKADGLHLSVSQVQRYLDCPLDFYYCYVLNVPQEASPTLEYGSIMHGLVEQMNKSLLDGTLIDLESLRAELLKAWPKSGYLSAGHRDRSQAQALKTLEAVYARVAETKRLPLAVEQAFSFHLPDDQLTIRGRLDAVFPLDDGVEIVDYKTSTSVNTPEKAKQRATASQQLTLYAMAWQLLHDELPKQVTLDFIDTGVTGSVKKTQRGIDGMKARLATLAQNIRAQQFEPGKDHLFCIHPPL